MSDTRHPHNAPRVRVHIRCDKPVLEIPGTAPYPIYVCEGCHATVLAVATATVPAADLQLFADLAKGGALDPSV